MEQETKRQRKLVTAVTLSPEAQAAVIDLASRREWSIAQTGGFLIRLGLEKLAEQSGEINQTGADATQAVAA